MRPVTRNELDRLGCTTPGYVCGDHVFLHPHCHYDAGTWASYDKATGVLTIRCRACERPFVSILVAERRPSPFARFAAEKSDGQFDPDNELMAERIDEWTTAWLQELEWGR